MARLRLLIVLAFALVMAGCPMLEQQENFVSFTWDGVQYFFTASAATEAQPWAAEHPYAVGYIDGTSPPFEYVIKGSATSEGASADPLKDTLVIHLIDNVEQWSAWAYFYDSYGNSTMLDIGSIPSGMIDTFIVNRDAVGEQLAGSMPGPFDEGGTTPIHELKDITFSVERLPNQQAAPR